LAREPTAASSCGAGRQVQLGGYGSSYLPSEINAAFLWAQLESAAAITQKRIDIWQQYHQAFASLEAQGKVRRPIIQMHVSIMLIYTALAQLRRP